MSSNHKLGDNNKELISERSQNNKLVFQNEIASNNELINIDQGNIETNKNENTQKPPSFNIDAMELEELMGKYKERGKDFDDLKYFEKKSVGQLINELQTHPHIKRFNGKNINCFCNCFHSIRSCFF